MELKKFSGLMGLLAICFVLPLNAQTGIFYYPLINQDFPNSSIVDLLETDYSNILMLNLCSDAKYLNPEIQIMTVKNTGERLNEAYLPIENLYNLVKIESVKPDGYRIFGNLSVNKQFVPIQIVMSSDCKEQSKNIETQSYSTLISDIKTDEGYYFILYTKSVKSEKYNISLNKLESATGKVVWLKKISSEQNEEADKLVVTKSGDIYILGKKYNDESTEYVPIIYRLDSQGNQLWKKGIDIPNNFNNQSIAVTDENEIIYICGYTKNPTGSSETKMVKLTADGEDIDNNSIPDFNANGLIVLNNKNVLLYGSKFLVDQKQVITKAKFAIINNALQEVITKTLDETDKPDSELKQAAKTSSDITTAIQLADGRIALAGRVFMPVDKALSQKQNVPLLLLLSKDGTYAKN